MHLVLSPGPLPLSGEHSSVHRRLNNLTGVGPSQTLPESVPGIHRNPPQHPLQEAVIPTGEEQMEPVLLAPATNNNDNNSNNHKYLWLLLLSLVVMVTSTAAATSFTAPREHARSSTWKPEVEKPGFKPGLLTLRLTVFTVG